MGEASTKQLSEQKKRPANVNTQDAAVRSAPDRPILRLKPGVGLLLVWMAIASFAQTSAKSDFPIGSYLDGDFIVTFSSDGKFIVENDVVVKAQGVYTIDGDQIVLKDKGAKGECAGEGKYQWKFDGKKLTFTRIEDDCAGRTHHLTSRAWPKIK